MMDNTVIERVKQVVEYLNISKKAFAEKINMEQTTVNNQILGKRSISFDLIKNIANTFDEISLDWLITGKGEMLNKEDPERKEKEIPISHSDIIEGDYTGALVYNVDGTCGAMERDMIFTRDNIIGSVNLPEINKESKIIRANGDSMEPVIFDGDRVVLRQIFNFDEIFYGQIYLILLEEYRMIKYIRRYEPDEENYVILRSRNKEYDDIKLHKSKIRKLFVVENILSVKSQL